MDLGLTGSAFLVTGGASGIGAACVEALRAEGARVAVLDRSPSADFSVDVTDEAQVRRGVESAVRELGRLDGVVCCAGISGPVGTLAPSVLADAFDAVLSVNVRGAFLTVTRAVEHLRRSMHPAVVLLASDSALVASPGMVPYCTSKGAVLMLGKSLAVDLARDGIRVNCVCPSVVDTPMSRHDLGVADGFAGAGYPVQTAAEVAGLVAVLLSPVTRAVNGTSLLADFGASAVSGFPA